MKKTIAKIYFVISILIKCLSFLFICIFSRLVFGYDHMLSEVSRVLLSYEILLIPFVIAYIRVISKEGEKENEK